MSERQLAVIAAEARDLYLEHYRALVRRLRSERPNVVPELLIEMGGPDGCLLRKLTRVDVIWGGPDTPSIVEANHRPVDTTSPLLMLAGPPALSLFPLVWNACEVFTPEPLVTGADFDAWFERWMDLEDEHPTDADGLSEVIHSVTVPSEGASGWGFSVNLGSAPTTALFELLTLPTLQLASELRVGSFTYR